MIIAGCGNATEKHAEAIPADGAKSASGLVVKDWHTGQLPEDPYQMIDDRILGYAEDVYLHRCMAQKKFDFPVVPFDWNSPEESKYHLLGISGTLTVEHAQKYGYHHRPPSQRNLLIRKSQDLIASSSPEFLAQLKLCQDEMGKVAPFKGSEKLMEAQPLIDEGIEKSAP
ncbi:MAG: hypothetical protein Q4A71_07295 [Actinomycetaceae bacterium]|nr:hypothetical protein [Actinomycetaceae bacterium]